MDRIDVNYFNVSNRINLADETRVNATSEESENWRKQNAPATCTFNSRIHHLPMLTYVLPLFSDSPELHYRDLLHHDGYESLRIPEDSIFV